jgi:hypothetical protein
VIALPAVGIWITSTMKLNAQKIENETPAMSPSLRKLALTAHVTSSVGWLGAIAAFLTLAVAGLTSQDAQMVRAAYLAMELIARFVIVPLAFASLLTGLIQSLGTPWGLFRHYWILAKLLLTVFATIVLLVKMELIGYAARLATETTLSRADLRAAGIELVVHSAGGVLVLLVPAVLSVYKPRGMTRYGARKQHERHALSQSIPPRRLTTTRNTGDTHIADLPFHRDSNYDTGVGPGRGSAASRPRWVNVFRIIVIVLVLLFVILHLTGHGPGGHTP